MAPRTCFGLMASTGLRAAEQLQRTVPPPPPPTTEAQSSAAGATALPYESPLLAFKSYRCCLLQSGTHQTRRWLSTRAQDPRLLRHMQ